MARRPRDDDDDAVEVDFEGVETGGGSGFHIPPGTYGMEVEAVKKSISSNDNEMFEWHFRGTQGKAKGKLFYFYTTFTPSSLYKLRETLEGLGIEVPDSRLKIRPRELKGLEGVGEVVDDEYQGKVRSKLERILRNGGGDEEEEEEEEESKPVKVKMKKRAAPKLAKDDVMEMSEDELDGVVEKYSLDVDLSDFKTLNKKRAATVEALGDMVE